MAVRMSSMLVLGAFCATVAFATWPVAFHDAQRTSRANFSGPARKPSVRWLTDATFDSSAGAPLVADGTIYVDGGNPNETELVFYLTTGEWQQPFTCGGIGTISGYFMYLASEPSSGKGVVAYNRYEYAILWSALELLAVSAPIASPDGSVIYVNAPCANPAGCDIPGGIYALDTADGSTVWVQPTPDLGYAGKLVAISRDSSLLYATYSDTILVAVFTCNGTIAWEFSNAAGWMSPPSVRSDGVVMVQTGDCGLLGLHGTTGAQVSLQGMYGCSTTPPVIGADDSVYVSVGDRYIMAWAADGTQKWMVSTPNTNAANGLVMDSAGVLYYSAPRDSVVALNASTGAMLWRVMADTDDFALPIVAAPGMLLVPLGNGSLMLLA